MSAACCITLGDIKAAFDHARICVLVDALRARRMPPALIAAIVSEHRRLRARPIFQNIDFGEETVDWTKSIRQGGIEGPWAWNQVIVWILSMLAPAWIQSGWGVWLGETADDDSDHFRTLHRPPVCTHAVWSENIFIVGKNREEVRLMMKSLTRVLVSNGLEWKPGSLAYLQSDAVVHADVSEQDDITFEIAPNEFQDSYLHDFLSDVGTLRTPGTSAFRGCAFTNALVHTLTRMVMMLSPWSSNEEEPC